MSGGLAHSWSSPFSALPRWEVEYPHFYHLPEDLRLDIESEGSVYVLGTRGTGKTTLLKSMDWEERATNEYLQRSLGSPFDTGLIGLYQEVPEARFADLDAWANSGKNVDDRIAAAYLDCFSIQLIGDAVRGLLERRILGLSASVERQIAADALGFFQVVLAGRRIPSLLDVVEAAHNAAQRLEEDAERGQSTSEALKTTFANYRTGHVTRLLSFGLAKALSEENPGPAWRFRHCLDEAETMSVGQLRALGSLIRLAKHPLTYVAAFTQVAADPSHTGLPFLPLSEHDLRTVSLDWFEEDTSGYRRTLARFRTLAAGVLKIRLEAWDEASPDSPHASPVSSDVVAKAMRDVVLPRWTIDQRLAHHLTQSDIPPEHPIFMDAGGTDVDPYLDSELDVDAPSELLMTTPALISYRAFLRSRGHGLPAEGRPKSRQQDNAEFRKRMVAAYLVICDEMQWDPLYCGWEEVLQLSDLCIRDFIWQMRELWREVQPSSGFGFITEPILPAAQSRALKEAAARKIAFSRKYLTVSPARTRRLVEGLAILTRELQASADDPSALASPERGIFVVNIPPGGSKETEAFELLSDAVRQGYIKVVRADSLTFGFRVHRCIAPLAGFSYRRPQYAFSLSSRVLVALSVAPDEHALRDIVARIVKPNVDQMSLFGTDFG